MTMKGLRGAALVGATLAALLGGSATTTAQPGAEFQNQGIREDLGVGQPVLIADHLNLTGGSPVAGPLAGGVPARFVDLTEAYSTRLRALAREVDPSLPEGVYAGLPGPQGPDRTARRAAARPTTTQPTSTCRYGPASCHCKWRTETPARRRTWLPAFRCRRTRNMMRSRR